MGDFQDFKVKVFHPKVLKQVLVEMPEKKNEIIKAIPNYREIISGKEIITFKQIEKISEITGIPFGYFFLDEIPGYPFHQGNKIKMIKRFFKKIFNFFFHKVSI